MTSKARSSPLFDATCKNCPRLAKHLAGVAVEQPTYHCAPVAAFGAAKPKLLIVGLAPGKHGANRTGRPFTGDFAGVLLYATLHKFNFATHAGSAEANDGLRLLDCRVTNAVKCLPPDNKPLPAEIRQCNSYLTAELEYHSPRVILALGRVAHEAVLMSLSLKSSAYRFAHGATHALSSGKGEVTLVDSYHCSRYNTQTKRLTAEMFESVVQQIKQMLDGR